MKSLMVLIAMVFALTPVRAQVNVTANCPQPQVGLPYSCQLSASVSGASWELVSGALPSGLSLNSDGLISGVPTTDGDFSSVIQANVYGQVTLKLSVAVPASLPASFYGVPWAADGMSNTPVGRAYHQAADYRFRADHTGSVTAVRIYLVFSKISKTCGSYYGYYAGGNGGRLKLSLQNDDGTANHLPTGIVLASTVITNPLACNPGVSSCTNSERLMQLSSAVPVVSGQLYHLVQEDVDASPSCNWVSNDNLYLSVGTPNMQPKVSDVDLAELIKTDSSGWNISYINTPIYELLYSDGYRAGQGFMEAWMTASSGTEYMVPSVSGTYSKAILRSTSGSGSAKAYDSSGKLLATATFTSFNAKRWGSAAWSAPLTLTAGKTYSFVLTGGLRILEDPAIFQTPNTMPGEIWWSYGSNKNFKAQFYLEQ